MVDKPTFLVVDDHPIFRHGLIALIQSEPRYRVIAEAGSVPEALAALEATVPTMALVDLSLGGQNGLSLLKVLKDSYPSVLTLVVSIYDEAVYAERVLKAQAKGYLMKQAAGTALKEAIRTILGGRIYVSAEYRDHFLETFWRPAQTRSLTTGLSDRELEVLAELGQGYAVAEIASRLNLSTKTIGVYQDHLKRKLGVESTADLRRYAIHWYQTQER
jgi:DNA-binding NarL/FixJ family response regulator